MPGTTYTVRVTAADANAGEYVLTATHLVFAPGLDGVVVNNGSSQRSRVVSVKLDFKTALTVAPGAITLTNGITTLRNLPGGGLISVANIVSRGTVLDLTFDSAVAGVDIGSLANGIGTLTVNATGVTNAATGTSMAANYTTTINRLKGDYDVNGTVNGNDLVAIGNFFNSNDITFDFDGNGVINGTDLTVFSNSFGFTM